MFLILFGAVIAANVVAGAVGKHESKKARKEFLKAQYRYEAKRKEAYRRAVLIQEALRTSGKVERKYSETLRRAERLQGGKGSRV